MYTFFEIRVHYTYKFNYLGYMLDFDYSNFLKSDKFLNLILSENIHDHMNRKPQYLQDIFH